MTMRYHLKDGSIHSIETSADYLPDVVIDDDTGKIYRTLENWNNPGYAPQWGDKINVNQLISYSATSKDLINQGLDIHPSESKSQPLRQSLIVGASWENYAEFRDQLNKVYTAAEVFKMELQKLNSIKPVYNFETKWVNKDKEEDKDQNQKESGNNNSNTSGTKDDDYYQQQ
jgi:hypothetical protein